MRTRPGKAEFRPRLPGSQNSPVPKVIIVAEEDPARELGHTVLWRPGVTRVWLRDPDAAIEQVKKHRPHMVVVSFPYDIASSQLVRQLREDEETRSLAIVIVEHRVSKRRHRELVNAGANAVIPRPVDPFRWDPRLEELLFVPERRPSDLSIRIEIRRRLSEPIQVDGKILNLSINGLLLETSSQIPPRALLDLTFELPGDAESPIVGVGRVARDAGGSRSLHRMGVELLMLRGEGRRWIHDFVHAGDNPRRGADDDVSVERWLREDREWGAVLRDPTLAQALDMEPARLESWLRRKVLEWRRTVDAINGVVLIADAEARIVRLNRTGLELSGIEDWSQLVGSRLADLRGGQPWDAMLDLASRGLSQTSRGERQVENETSGRSWAITVGPIERDEHEGEQMVMFARETTELIELQEEVKRAEMMATLGALVGGVTHEMRNGLFNLSSCLDAFEAVGDKRILARQRPELDRMVKFSQELLDYGRPSSAELRPGDLAPVLENAAEATRSLAEARDIEISVTTQGELPQVELDEGRLLQVFQNLIQNGVQHGPPGSRVSLSARADDRRVVCTVTDEGAGVDPAHLNRIFEPFYSLRQGGTGLGLSIVKRIVEDHRGEVEVENDPSGGALVTVRLPAARAADA